MKKNLIAQALLLLATTGAIAQTAPTAPAAPVVEDKNGTQFMKVNVAPSVESVNPFRGVPLNVEQLQKQLEISKIQTQLFEEQLRNAGLQEDLKNLPIRKQAEIAQALTQTARESAQREQIARDARGLVQADEESREEANRRRRDEAEARKAAARREAAEEKRRNEQATLTARDPVAQSQSPAPSRIEVLGVTTVGDKRSALLAINANIASVQDGDVTPLGTVTISPEGVVRLNGQTQLMQEATISRVKLSETAQTSGTGSGANGMAAPPTLVIGSQPASASIAAPTFVPPPVPGSSSSNGRTNPVPQIQLPSGVSLVPSAR